MNNRILLTLGVVVTGCGGSPIVPAAEHDGTIAVYRGHRALIQFTAPQEVRVSVPKDARVVCIHPRFGATPTPKADAGWRTVACGRSSWVEVAAPEGPEGAKSTEFLLCIDDCEGADAVLRGRIEPLDGVATPTPAASPSVSAPAPPSASSSTSAQPAPAPPLQLVHRGGPLAQGAVLTEKSGLPVSLFPSRTLQAGEGFELRQSHGRLHANCGASGALTAGAKCVETDVTVWADANTTAWALVCTSATGAVGACATIIFKP